jgi:hypothetical protein
MFLSKTGLLRIRDGVRRSVAGRPINELGETSIVSMRQDVQGNRGRGLDIKRRRCGEPSHGAPTHPTTVILSDVLGGGNSPNSSLCTYKMV